MALAGLALLLDSLKLAKKHYIPEASHQGPVPHLATLSSWLTSQVQGPAIKVLKSSNQNPPRLT